jgi:polysaccharide biosynthesis protein PslA
MPYPKAIRVHWYAISDWFCSLLAWILFYELRRYYLYSDFEVTKALREPTFWFGVLAIPIGWLLLFAASGSYRTNTAITSFIGVLFIFFIFLIDDIKDLFDLSYYYKGFTVLFILQFVITFFGRALILTRVKKQINSGKAGFNVLMMGTSEMIKQAYQYLPNLQPIVGWHLLGYLLPPEEKAIRNFTPSYLGDLTQLDAIIEAKGIEKIILAFGKMDADAIKQILDKLAGKDVEILIIPQVIDILTGAARTGICLQVLLLPSTQALCPTGNKTSNASLMYCLALQVLYCLAHCYFL